MRNTLPLTLSEESALVVEGSVSAALVTILQTAVLRMMPYALPAVALLILDLLYGVKAAKCRGEQVRASTAIRRTTTKFFSYVVWLILASTLAISFKKDFLEWGTLALVYANEALSIIGNYFETKGLSFSIVGAYQWFLRFVAGKVGVEVDPNDIIKDKEDGNKD